MTAAGSFRVCAVLLAVYPVAAAAATTQADEAIRQATGIVFQDNNGDGVRDPQEPGLPDVCVSNGRDVVRTDADGRYVLPVGDDTILFVIKPSHYRTRMDENHVPRFYYIHKPNGSPSGLRFPGVPPTGPLPDSVDFPLVPAEEPSAFDVIFFGDPQPRDQREIDYIAHDVVEGLIGTDAAFGVTLGDILFDDLSLFESSNRTIGRIGIPWYNVIGNHDINFAVDQDEFSDETFERVFGPPWYSFNYGGVHFLVIDDIHWMTDGERRFYRSGLSTRQLDFIENDLREVPQDQLVVAVMHIPLVKSTPWIEPPRARLLRLLESRDHCISLAGHTHHHEHVLMDAGDGWNGSAPHHHIINVTVSGAWWSGKPDEHGIPHTTCADGTPNGYTVMHFDGTRYLLEYRAARREPEYQVRITAPEVVASSGRPPGWIYANVFNAIPGAEVQFRLNRGPWSAMTKTVDETDPLFQALFDEEQPMLPDDLPWRKLAKPLVCPHLWKVPVPAGLPRGSHTIEVRATNPNGQVLGGRRVIRVE